MTDEETKAKKALEAKEREALKAEFGDDIVAHKSASFGWLVFKAPTLEAYEEFIDECAKDKGRKATAMRSLCQQCGLKPGYEELRVIFAKKPGLATVIAPQLVALASDDAEALGKD